MSRLSTVAPWHLVCPILRTPLLLKVVYDSKLGLRQRDDDSYNIIIYQLIISIKEKRSTLFLTSEVPPKKIHSPLSFPLLFPNTPEAPGFFTFF